MIGMFLIVCVLTIITACGGDHEPGEDLKRETVFDKLVHFENRLRDIPDVSRIENGLDIVKKRVNIGDAELYVLEEGEGIPLVLLNGGPGNSLHSFLPHFSQAAEFSRIIYYDPRGVGLSDWQPGEGYSTEQIITDLDKLRQKLSIEKWFILGHSYGGLVAQRYTIKYPASVLGIVLVASSVPMQGIELGEREYRLDSELKRIREIYSIQGNAVVPVHSDAVDLPTSQRMVYNGYLNGDWKRQYYYKPSVERMAQIALYEWVHDRDFNRLARADGFAKDLTMAFKDSPIPTLIIEGKWDPNWGARKPELFQMQHPRAQLVVFGNSSHFAFSEEPERFCQVLKDFIRSSKAVSESDLNAWKSSLEDREGDNG